MNLLGFHVFGVSNLCTDSLEMDVTGAATYLHCNIEPWKRLVDAMAYQSTQVPQSIEFIIHDLVSQLPLNSPRQDAYILISRRQRQLIFIGRRCS